MPLKNQLEKIMTPIDRYLIAEQDLADAKTAYGIAEAHHDGLAHTPPNPLRSQRIAELLEADVALAAAYHEMAAATHALQMHRLAEIQLAHVTL